MDNHRLPAWRRDHAASRRQDRRSLRTEESLHDLRRHLHDVLAPLWHVDLDLHAGPAAVYPSDRRWGVHALGERHRRGELRQGSRSRDWDVHEHLPPRRAHRPGARRHHHPGLDLARHLLHQHPHRRAPRDTRSTDPAGIGPAGRQASRPRRHRPPRRLVDLGDVRHHHSRQREGERHLTPVPRPRGLSR